MNQKIYKRGIRQLFRISVPDIVREMRLDQFLCGEIPELSRTEVRKIIDIGGVHLNGRRVRTSSSIVQNEMQIELYTDGLSFDIFRLKDEHLLYQDNYLLVLNKPAGIDTQPTPSRYKGTLYDALLVHLGPTPGRKKPELGMVQRLDRGTSGLMVFSTHQKSHPSLSKIFLEHRVDKRYLALVENPPNPASGEIRSMLARSRKYNRMVSVSHGGKDAITRYQTRDVSRSGALLEIELLTGRSHQIRAHMSEAGSALLGDSLYGGTMTAAGEELARPMLHAHHLSFMHPVTSEKLSFDLPMPTDMQFVSDKLLNPEKNF